LFPTGGFFIQDVPKLALHEMNGDSAGNYHLMDEEWLFHGELPAQDEEST
jgi:hypothetical protein